MKASQLKTAMLPVLGDYPVFTVICLVHQSLYNYAYNNTINAILAIEFHQNGKKW